MGKKILLAESFSDHFSHTPLYVPSSEERQQWIDIHADSGSADADAAIISDMSSARHFSFSKEFISSQLGNPSQYVPQEVVLGSTVSLPFPQIWVEPEEEPYTLFSYQPLGRGSPPVDVYGALISEIGPEFYRGVFVVRSSDKTLVNLFGDSGSQHMKGFFHIFDKLFKAMRFDGASFIERTPGRWKIGTGKNRALVQPKRIVRVLLKAERKKYEARRGEPIDWSHQWEVMGHWRRVAGTGKDRSGRYCVPGYTWVAPHRRGPEDKVFVKKTRIVSQDAPRAVFN